MIPAIAALAMLAVVLYFLGHHDEQGILERWDMTLNPEGLQVYSNVAQDIADERWKQDVSYEDAFVANMRGETVDAIRFLRLGSQVVGDCSDTVLNLLTNLTELASHAAAIAPMPPLWPRSFHARRLVTLAGLHQLGHHLLVTTRDRFAFRLAVLRYGVRAAAGMVVGSTDRLSRDMTDGRRWLRVDQLRGDLGALTDESLETLRLVLASLAAVPRPVPVRQRKTA